MSDDLKERIKSANVEVHAKEAQVYESLHTEIFNFWEQRRIKNDIDFMIDHIDKADIRVLDIGCGTGNLLIKFMKEGFYVTGVDISKEMLDVLRSKNLEQSVTLIHQDVDSYISTETAKYDIITFSSTLHHLPSYTATVSNALNLLEAGGLLYIVHEPLPKGDQNPIWRRLVFLDSYLFRASLKFRRVKAPRKLDYTYSDYHAKKGLSMSDLRKVITEGGCKEIRYEEYNPAKLGILSFLQTKLIPRKRFFKLIVMKERNTNQAAE